MLDRKRALNRSGKASYCVLIVAGSSLGRRTIEALDFGLSDGNIYLVEFSRNMCEVVIEPQDEQAFLVDDLELCADCIQIGLRVLAEMLGRTPSNEDEAGDDVDPLLSKPSVATIGMVTGGQERIRRQVRVDQKPIGRTPRSNLATYSGLFDHVRRLFATTPLARRRHYSPSRFSFNVAGGRCPVCNGEGFVMVELLFLPSVYAPCSVCHGARYNPETLEVTWQDRTIADVLAMTVDDAWQFFANEPAIHRSLTTLRDIGLGYLRLGQPATELSGGEAQRVKLATELQRAEHGTTLYILDEPTAGLHPADADRLLQQLQRLVDADNTVVIVEHDMRIVAQTDYVIDMGPGAGDLGGTVVAHGTPQEVAKVHDSATAPFLKKAITGKK